jgi:5-methylcytosine-specific restriction endonuclease McrA
MARDIQKLKEHQKRWYQENKKKVMSRTKNRRRNAEESAVKSLYTGVILNTHLWSFWIKEKIRNISYDLTANEAFNLMIQRCYYCGDFATTLDRLDSNLTHTLDNCVGSCIFCNKSKGAQDPMTFILQAVYRRRFIYYKDEDIWHDNTSKTWFYKYQANALKQGRKFELTKEQFNLFIVGNCHYCKRSPSKGKFFGIDKLIPDDGYIMSNCVTACASCNYSKRDSLLEEFTLRDERITEKYLAGYFNDMPSFPKNTSNFKS